MLFQHTALHRRKPYATEFFIERNFLLQIIIKYVAYVHFDKQLHVY